MKTYLIAGGSSGIGLETVRLLSASNNINAISRTQKNLENLPNFRFYQADVTNSEDKLPALEGEIHGILYAPGSINLKPFKNLKAEDFRSDFELNLIGAVTIIRKYLDNLKAAGNASIVLFSTVAVQTGMPYHASVAAAKGAVEGLTRSLAAEFAPSIRVNCLAPSLTSTPLAERLINTEVKLEASKERHPLKRIGSAAETAELVSFLLSEKSSFITGQVIKIDGGISSLKLL